MNKSNQILRDLIDLCIKHNITICTGCFEGGDICITDRGDLDKFGLEKVLIEISEISPLSKINASRTPKT